jgi:hypothetical protein
LDKVVGYTPSFVALLKVSPVSTVPFPFAYILILLPKLPDDGKTKLNEVTVVVQLKISVTTFVLTGKVYDPFMFVSVYVLMDSPVPTELIGSLFNTPPVLSVTNESDILPL